MRGISAKRRLLERRSEINQELASMKYRYGSKGKRLRYELCSIALELEKLQKRKKPVQLKLF